MCFHPIRATADGTRIPSSRFLNMRTHICANIHRLEPTQSHGESKKESRSKFVPVDHSQGWTNPRRGFHKLDRFS